MYVHNAGSSLDKPVAYIQIKMAKICFSFAALSKINVLPRVIYNSFYPKILIWATYHTKQCVYIIL